jgi:hypothetical protein
VNRKTTTVFYIEKKDHGAEALRPYGISDNRGNRHYTAVLQTATLMFVFVSRYLKKGKRMARFLLLNNKKSIFATKSKYKSNKTQHGSKRIGTNHT